MSVIMCKECERIVDTDNEDVDECGMCVNCIEEPKVDICIHCEGKHKCSDYHLFPDEPYTKTNQCEYYIYDKVSKRRN